MKHLLIEGIARGSIMHDISTIVTNKMGGKCYYRRNELIHLPSDKEKKEYMIWHWKRNDQDNYFLWYNWKDSSRTQDK